MYRPFLLITLLLISQIATAAFWDRPSMREPFIDGMEAMVDSMRDNPPDKDNYGRFGQRYNWLDPEPDTPFPSSDPWLEELPLGKAEDSPFFRIPDSVKIRGRWLGQYGDGLWIKAGWIRIYRNDDYRDGRYRIKGNTLYIGFESTRTVVPFEYAIEDDLLALRDKYGRTYLYQRFDEEEEVSSDYKFDSNDK